MYCPALACNGVINISDSNESTLLNVLSNLVQLVAFPCTLFFFPTAFFYRLFSYSCVLSDGSYTYARNNGSATVGDVFYAVLAGALYGEPTGMTVRLPCGGGAQYLHRNPASRRRRRKGNPVRGSITGATLFLRVYMYGDLALQVGEVSNLRQLNMVMSPARLGPANDCAGEDQQKL
jgi:hypothetical protein